MIINGSRIRSLTGRFAPVPTGSNVIVGLSDLGSHIPRLEEAGFPEPWVVGQRAIPRFDFGRISDFNARGREIVRRDLPMETRYRTVTRPMRDWQGNMVDRTFDVPYQAYPVERQNPPRVALEVGESNGELVLRTPPVAYTAQNEQTILHNINLVLEIFGTCTVFDDTMEPIVRARTRRVEWHMLPAGTMPWPALRDQLTPIMDRLPAASRAEVSDRFHTLYTLRPTEVALSYGEFQGYVAFIYGDRERVALESTEVNNATYVFGEDWETFSQFTKAQVIQNNLHLSREVHRGNWTERISEAIGFP